MLDRPFALFGHCLGALTAHMIAEALVAQGADPPIRLFVSAARAPHEGYYGPVPRSLPRESIEQQVRRALAVMGERYPSTELVELGMATLKRDLEAFLASPIRQPGGPCFPITALSWIDDVSVSAEDMAGWSDFGSVTAHVLPGDHYQILSPPTALLETLMADGLDDAAEYRLVRGRRVDLTAVERALLATGRVRQAAVLVAGHGPDARIVAHIAADDAILTHDLRQALRREIPAWMLPDQWVRCDILPRTAAGAIDSEQLHSGLDADTGFRLPENWAEARVVEAWAGLLPADQVSVLDEFADCGGNSLIALRLARRLSADLGVEIGITAMQEWTTPRDLARLDSQPGCPRGCARCSN